MKKLGLEHHETSTYLVYKLGPEDTVDSVSMGMLVNNRIPGYVPTIFTQTDNIKQIKFDVTGLVTADQYLMGAVNKKRLLGVFRGIVQAFSSAEDYMIDARTIQLDLNSIFVHVVTGEAFLLCAPVVLGEEQQKPDIRAFLKSILFSAQYDVRENQDYVAKIMSYLNGMPIFSLREFKNLLDYLAMESVLQPEQPAAQLAAPVESYSGAETGERPSAYLQQKVEDAPEIPVVPEDSGDESEISLFYLLQHYNKENAAVYKAQKEARKAKKKSSKKSEKGGPEDVHAPQGFAVPGQPESPGDVEASPVSAGAKARPAVQAQPAPHPRPVQPVQPIQPQPIQPVQPICPAQPIQPVQPIQPIQPVQPVQTVRPFPVQGAPIQPVQPAQTVRPSPVADTCAEPKDKVDFSTVYFSENNGDETVMMGQGILSQRPVPYLLRKRNGEKIPINKPIFRIGRDATYNDYAIIENLYIGHNHCHILTRNGEYFLVDDNSKNQTKVNGEALVTGVEMKLAHGYMIRMADEDFEFHIY